MNPWDAYPELKRELDVNDADLDLDPYWLPELALRFKESGRTPKKETKAAFLSLFEDPLEWFDTDLFRLPLSKRFTRLFVRLPSKTQPLR